MRSNSVRDLMSIAAGSKAQGDRAWQAEGIRRLYFDNPTDINSAGMVDVSEKEGAEPSHVRVELWISPQIAAEVIAHITGREELTIRALVRTEVIQRETDRIASQYQEPEEVHGDGLDVPASALALEKEDDARSETLTRVIKDTGGLGEGTDEDEEPATETAAAEITRLTLEQAEDDAQ